MPADIASESLQRRILRDSRPAMALDLRALPRDGNGFDSRRDAAAPGHAALSRLARRHRPSRSGQHEVVARDGEHEADARLGTWSPRLARVGGQWLACPPCSSQTSAALSRAGNSQRPSTHGHHRSAAPTSPPQRSGTNNSPRRWTPLAWRRPAGRTSSRLTLPLGRRCEPPYDLTWRRRVSDRLSPFASCGRVAPRSRAPVAETDRPSPEPR